MKKIITENKSWILIGGYVIFIVVFIYCYLSPGIAKIEDQAKKIQEKILDKKILENRLSQLSDMEAKSQNFNQNKENLGKIVTDSEEVEFIKYIENLAQETGNEVNIVVPENQYNDEKAKKASKVFQENGGDIIADLSSKKFIILEVSLAGDFQQAFNFIEKIENSSYYSNVISFNMEKVESSQENRSNSIFSPTFSKSSYASAKTYLKTVINLVVYKQ